MCSSMMCDKMAKPQHEEVRSNPGLVQYRPQNRAKVQDDCQIPGLDTERVRIPMYLSWAVSQSFLFLADCMLAGLASCPAIHSIARRALAACCVHQHQSH